MKKYIAIVLILIFSICYAGTFKWQIKIENLADGTFFNSTDSAGASVRLYHSDAAGATGTLSQTMTEISNGIWYADVDTDSAGWYEVKTYTDADPSWTSVSGFDPVWIGTKEYLPLDGSKSMTDTLGMGNNQIKNASAIAFFDSTGPLRYPGVSIEAYNILDKSADEDIAGLWDFASNKLSIDDTAITVTAQQINALSGVESGDAVVSLQKSVSNNARSTVTSNITLTPSDAGYIPTNTSGGDVTIVLPSLANTEIGASFYFYENDGSNNCYIVPNAIDNGFAFMTGSAAQTFGDTLNFDSSGSEGMIKAGAGSGGTGIWLISYGQKITIQ